jgi:tyrosine-protein phosphatase SIW14
MRVTRLLPRQAITAALLVVSLAAPAAARPAAAPATTASSLALATIRIDNFGRLNDNYYRGAQPGDRDYTDLAALGIRTVIDLTRDGRSDEQGLVEGAGMKFVRIPLTTSDRPSDAAVLQFLALVNDPANQPVYVHCQGGRHRTGVMTAVYRMTEDGWTADRAYAEMKQFNFEGFPGHPTLKTFVFDYYTQNARTRFAANEPSPAIAAEPASGVMAAK